MREVRRFGAGDPAPRWFYRFAKSLESIFVFGSCLNGYGHLSTSLLVVVAITTRKPDRKHPVDAHTQQAADFVTESSSGGLQHCGNLNRSDGHIELALSAWGC
ncbi:unnamed protein product [Phytophthora fragariaefolia]|uniref:Unnamed protein product n=1 Tax=Phytophthora fragariaefolia TaxID=1490495 RepID=A0A9W6TVQ0_9STRA|nr:unnamed protein product [Phytophthora fragariaefolia]